MMVGKKHKKITSFFGPSQPKRIKPTVDNFTKNLPVIEKCSTSEIFAAPSPCLGKGKVERFFQEMCPTLLSADVLQNGSFVDGMNSCLGSIFEFNANVKDYKMGQQKTRKKSQLFCSVEHVHERLNLLNEKMKAAGKIELSISLGSSQLSMQATTKSAKLMEILALSSEIATFIEKERLNYKLKKRISQQNKATEDQPKENDLTISCYNSQKSWEDCYLSLERKTVKFPTCVSALDIFHICSIIEQDTFVDESIIGFEHRKNIIDFIVRHFPVMYAKKMNAGVLMNIHDLLMLPDLLITIDEEQPKNANNDEVAKKVKPKSTAFGPFQKRGRKPLHETYPNLVQIITDFIRQHSFSAHNRRRETTGTGVPYFLYNEHSWTCAFRNSR